MDIVDRLNSNAPSIMAMRDGAEEIMRLRRELDVQQALLASMTESRDFWRGTAEDRRSESKSGGEIPPGWKLVPVEPTTDMWDQAETAMIIADTDAACGDRLPGMFDFPTQRIWLWVLGYRAAMKAAPEPSEHSKPGGKVPGYMGDVNGPGCDPDTP